MTDVIYIAYGIHCPVFFFTLVVLYFQNVDQASSSGFWATRLVIPALPIVTPTPPSLSSATVQTATTATPRTAGTPPAPVSTAMAILQAIICRVYLTTYISVNVMKMWSVQSILTVAVILQNVSD